GIYHEGGKGIHLNDIYLHFKDTVSIETDKQVYAPGEIIHALFSSEQNGILTVDAFGESQTLPISASTSTTFQVPADTLGGTYGINWRLVPGNTSQEERSGSHSFDVSGLVVKVAKSALEKGKYMPGETIKATYSFESNRDDSLSLRCWVITPANNWTYLGESSVTVSAAKQTNAVSSYSFNTTEAGTHELVYGLYQEDNLVVSGRLAFDVGDAVLIGIETDKYEYKEGNENVNVKINYFGEGSAGFELYLDSDNEKVAERTLTIHGIGNTEITLNSSSLSGGSHRLKAVLTKDGLTSTKTTGFLYGTNLPDLTPTSINSSSTGLNYTYQVNIKNSGKTTSPLTTLAFTDNTNPVETISIPSLAPGASHEITFNWSGSGKAGHHEFEFILDPTNTVKEYSESNNRLTIEEDVPFLFYNLEVEPVIWPANSDINIITRLINNQNQIASLTLNLAITPTGTGTAIFQRTHMEELPAFGTKTLNDHFNTGITPAGEYTLSQAVTGTSGENIHLHQEIPVLIEVTKTISGNLELLPAKIPAGIDNSIECAMNLKNTGNVNLEEETAVIKIVNKENDDIVKTEQFIISIPLSQEIPLKKNIALNLSEGQYDIRLMYQDNLIATAELTVIPPIKPEKTIAIHPRVLIMNLQTPGNVESINFLSNLLNSSQIQTETAAGQSESYFQFHKGHANINIIWGHTLGRKWRDELKERTWRGEGLILIGSNPLNSPDMVEWLGVNVNPVTGKEKTPTPTTPTTLEILPHELSGSGGFVELVDKNRFILEKKKEDVIIIGQTQQKQPVIAYRKYGRGHILVFTTPIDSLKSGHEIIAQLLLNAVNLFSNDIYTISTLTRILPIEISLANEGSAEKNLTVKEILPYGVDAYDFSPALDKNGDENEIKWQINVPGKTTKIISYWLKCPDQTGTFDIKTEIYDGQIKLEEVALNIDVSQTVHSRLIDVIVELEALDVSGPDTQYIRQAKNFLENILNRSVGSLSDHLLNLHDAVKATESIGKIMTMDVSSLRSKVGDIMIIMGRRFYEAVAPWNSSLLLPLAGLITAD
ncbi:MAG TPA: CARDB domain-containing protein, partial [Candidatus Kapabacteria bacterium]|nr:CARDB domain-containing protein [Candidatus Kapabacteria bacterium]